MDTTIFSRVLYQLSYLGNEEYFTISGDNVKPVKVSGNFAGKELRVFEKLGVLE